MRDRLAHRGPDDTGTWLDPAAGLAFGFRRLSIVDLSPAGHQPMLSASGRYVLVMNGEIYNYAAIRAEIDAVRGGHPWRGHCDTEVLLEAIDQWGLEGALSRANGMFALAAWDRRDRVLWMARDRIGKKPLYYGWAGRSFVFASELKALWSHPDFDARISTGALSSYMQLGYVPGRESIFAAVAQLPPGHLLRLDPDAASRRATPCPVPYWRLRDAALAGLEARRAGRAATEDELEALIQDAVRLRMVADVPVGVLMSGGVDSSLVAAMMVSAAAGPVRSFAIGFDLPQWDEAPHARAVAEHLGTAHEELYARAADLVDFVADLPGISDEPFADDSLIPMVLLSRMARRSVTVALSGDGGDELFAGYQRYAAADRWLARRDSMPAPARAVAGGLIRHAGPAARRWGSRRLQRRLHLLGSLLGAGTPEQFQNVIMSQSQTAPMLLAGTAELRDPLAEEAYALGASTPIDRMTYMDTASFLVDDILTKVDRASMSASLEVRCPLLDYRVIELSWRFPTEAKLRDGVGKAPLRSILFRHVPRALVDRPKMGFSVPIEQWLRHDLRDWAESLMSRDALASHGLLDAPACRALWEGFATRGRGWDRTIWNLLMFQAWYAKLRDVVPAPDAVPGADPVRRPARAPAVA